MKSYSMAEFKESPAKVIEKARREHENALIMVHGRPNALVVPIEPEDVEWSESPKVAERLKRALAERAAGRLITPGRRRPK